MIEFAAARPVRTLIAEEEDHPPFPTKGLPWRGTVRYSTGADVLAWVRPESRRPGDVQGSRPPSFLRHEFCAAAHKPDLPTHTLKMAFPQ